MLLDHLKPIAQEHSLRQVIANIFLLQPIVEPKRYESLLRDFKNRYQKFELTTSNTLGFRIDKGVLINHENRLSKESGYRFVGFENGRLSKILKHENRDLNNQEKGIISYYSLNYPEWNNFKKNLFEDLNVINNIDNSFFNAISLNYLNEFTWDSDDDIPINEIFNSGADFLSEKFFNSQNSSFLISTEDFEGDKQVVEKLEIVVSKQNKKIVTNSELAFRFGTNFKLESSIIKTKLNEEFELVHDKLKGTLRRLFSEEVKNKINL